MDSQKPELHLSCRLLTFTAHRNIKSTIIEYANGRMERLQAKLETTDRDLGKFKQKSSFKLSHIGNIQNIVKETFLKSNKPAYAVYELFIKCAMRYNTVLLIPDKMF